MNDLDSQIRDSEINLTKDIKNKHIQKRKQKLAKILSKQQQNKQQVVKTKITQKSKKKPTNQNLHILFKDYMNLKNIKSHVCKGKILLENNHGYADLAPEDKAVLYNIKLLKSLHLATCKTFNLKKINDSNSKIVGYIPYKLIYKNKFCKIMHKYCRSGLYSTLNKLVNFGKTITDGTAMSILISIGFFIAAIVFYNIYPLTINVSQQQVSEIICGSSLFTLLLWFLTFTAIAFICCWIGHFRNKLQKFMYSYLVKNKKNFCDDLYKNTQHTFRRDIKKLI